MISRIYSVILCGALKRGRDVGLVRPQRGGKCGFAAHYVISALRPVFIFTKASRNRQNKYGEDKTPPYLFRRFMRRLQSVCVYDKISFFERFSRVCRTISTFIYLKVIFYHYTGVL